MTISEISELSFTEDWARWHKQHEALLADKHGGEPAVRVHRPRHLPAAAG